MKSNVIRRVWAWILVACMLFTMVPAFAEDTAAEVEAPAPVETVAEEPASEPAAEPVAEAEPEAEEPVAEAEPETEEPEPETTPAPEAEGPAPLEAPVVIPLGNADDGIMTAAEVSAKPTRCPTGAHVWDESRTTVQVEGDCNNKRQEIKYCTVCQELYLITLDYVHKYVETTLPADCTHGQRKLRMCSNPACLGNAAGDGPAIDPDYEIVETGEALGHKFDRESFEAGDHVEATCQQAGKSTWICTRDNCPGDGVNTPAKKVENYPKADHVRGAQKHQDATCTTNERYVWQCTNCNEVIDYQDVPGGKSALEHEWGAWTTNSDGTHTRICANYAKMGTFDSSMHLCPLENGQQIENCSMVEDVALRESATCASAAVYHYKCSKCTYTTTAKRGSPDSSNHTYVLVNVDNDTPANIKCGDKNITVREKCSNPAHGDNPVYGRTITYTEESPVPHIMDNGTPTKEATCMQTGVMTYTCTRNGCTGGGSGPYTETKVIPIDKDAHDWDTATTEPATCTENQKIVRKCKNQDKGASNTCPAVDVVQEVPGTALGHTFFQNGKFVQDKAKSIGFQSSGSAAADDITNGYKKPTCTEDGYVTYKCDRPEGVGTCDVEQVVTLVATGHTKGTTQNKERDCENPDRTVVLCKTCGEEIPEETKVTPNGRSATGHKWSEDGWQHVTSSEGSGTTNEKKAASKHQIECVNPWCTQYTSGKELKESCNFVYVTKPATCMTDASEGWECTECKFYIKVTDVNVGTKNPNNHEWKTTKKVDLSVEATCTTPGYDVFKCQNPSCTAVKTVEIEAGHQWADMSAANTQNYVGSTFETDDKKYEDKHPCKDEIRHWQICTRANCPANTTITAKEQTGAKDKAVQQKITPATGDHHYVEVATVTAATCLKNAISGGYKCSVCNEYDPNRMPEEIPGTAKGHLFTTFTVTVPATCSAYGERTYTCQYGAVCDGYDETAGADNKGATGENSTGVAIKTEQIEKLNHTPEARAKHYDADCTHDEREVIECSVCHEPISTVYPEDGELAKGHKFGNVPWTYKGDGKHTRTCTVCGTALEIPCSLSETSELTPANCTYPEGTTYTCTVCGHERFQATGTATAPGKHVFESAVASSYNATCNAPGVAKKTCKYCGASGGYEAIPADHQWGTGVLTKDATCEEPGIMTYTCTNTTDCPYYLAHDKKESATKTEEIPATGHAWDEGTLTKNATCTDPGEKVVTCQICGKKTTQTVPAAGHTWVKNVTDDSGFATINYCSVCGEIEFVKWNDGISADNKNCENVKKTVNDVEHGIEHATEAREEIPATPDAPGHEAGTYCTRCERYITGGDEIPYVPTEHTQHVWVVEPVRDATFSCMVTYCGICGEIYTPLAEENWLITEGRDCEKVYIEFKGEKKYAKHAEAVSETEPGFTAGTKCPACGKWLTGHAPIEEDCDHAELYKQLAAGTLKPVEDSVVPATCVAKAKATFVCPTCSEEVENVEYGEVDTKFGHNYVKSHQGDVITYDETKGVVAAATCTKAKTTTYTCTLCEATVAGHSTAVTDGAALGHSWERNGFDITLEANRTDANGWKVDEEAKPGVAGKGHYECTDKNCDAATKPAKSADVTIAALPVEPSFQEYTVTLNADAPLRETASSFSSQKQLVPEGTTVTVTGEAEGAQKNFYPVRLADGTTGYMSSSYLVGLK